MTKIVVSVSFYTDGDYSIDNFQDLGLTHPFPDEYHGKFSFEDNGMLGVAVKNAIEKISKISESIKTTPNRQYVQEYLQNMLEGAIAGIRANVTHFSASVEGNYSGTEIEFSLEEIDDV